jgi:membrane-associated phospholipid phosphatase
MRLLGGCLLIAALALPRHAAAQEIENPDGGDQSTPQATAPAVTTPASKQRFYLKSWTRFVPNVLNDQKRIWLFPVAAVRGRHIKPTLAIIGVTAGLFALDSSSGRHFHRTESLDGFNRVFSGPHTARAMQYLPAAFLAVGILRKDRYAQETFMHAGEAVLSSSILTSVLKDVTRRLNPGIVPAGGNYSNTWFQKQKGSWVRGIGSFPSGHTIAAFSIAAVFAERYPKSRWLRWTAYGLAAVVGFSRVSLETHFPSDVFLGAALGHIIGKNVVRDGQK